MPLWERFDVLALPTLLGFPTTIERAAEMRHIRGLTAPVNLAGIPALAVPVPTVNARQDLRRYREGTAASQGSPNDDHPPLSFDRPEPACHVPLEARLRDSMPGRVGSTLAPRSG